MTRWALAIITLFVCAAGCAVRTPAATARSAIPAGGVEIQWPERRAPVLPALFQGDPGPLAVDRVGRYGRGELVALRATEHEGDDLPASIFFFRSEPPESPGILVRPIVAVGPPDEVGERLVLFDSTTPTLMVVQLPLDELPPRGTVVFLTGLNGATPFEQAMVREMRGRGWAAVLVMPSMVKKRALDLDDRSDSDDPAEVRIASQIDGSIADRTYAVEAMLTYLARERPEITQDPLVLMGASAGALAVPSAAARLGRVDAAVLIAGGADVFRILRESPIGRGRFRFERNGEPVGVGELRELMPEVLDQVELDPAWTASALLDTPVLMLHAMFDRVVPAESGDELYLRLGRPERWSYPVGHYGLFALLPSQAQAVGDWVENATGTGP